MLGKKVIKFKGSKLGQILCADKTGFHRPGHIYPCRDVTIWVDAILRIASECIEIYCRIAICGYRLIKEHIMSLKLAKKLSRNVKLYCIFLVQSFLQCNNWILTTWKAKNVTIYCNMQYIDILHQVYCIVLQ